MDGAGTAQLIAAPCAPTIRPNEVAEQKHYAPSPAPPLTTPPYPFSQNRAIICSIINRARLTNAGSPSSMDGAAMPHPPIPISCNVAATRPVSPIGEAGCSCIAIFLS